ncbi:hypothetical protein Gogos_009679, partial [Gossypium gossypioides]|nr:hypothetical protein [Gossypium gossypioides]
MLCYSDSGVSVGYKYVSDTGYGKFFHAFEGSSKVISPYLCVGKECQTQGFAAGLMLSISFLDLAHNAMNSIGFLKGNLWFFSGVIFFAVVANFIPEPTLSHSSEVKGKKNKGDEGGKDMMKKHRRQVFFSGIITAIGISLHNFPEGMAVFLGSMKGLRVGLNLALAIALHNIPE